MADRRIGLAPIRTLAAPIPRGRSELIWSPAPPFWWSVVLRILRRHREHVGDLLIELGWRESSVDEAASDLRPSARCYLPPRGHRD